MDVRPLIRKYSLSGPRYTSYPTAPQWTEKTVEDYRAHLGSRGVSDEESLGLYVHIPFCESLCYYCGCNIQISKDQSRAKPYVEAIKREVTAVSEALGAEKPRISQISWGGGTPTFLTCRELEDLHKTMACHFSIEPDADISMEIDPRVTSEDQLVLLRQLGFNRISLGVQDFNEKVQKAVNRMQSPEMTDRMLRRCRELGFIGLNFDLIYGLPWQTLESFKDTLRLVVEMGPDRIALYNYARLPRMIKHQEILEDLPMPEADDRVELYAAAYEAFCEAGYRPIGMDHFAKGEDELTRALDEGYLYRNFMGYVAKRSAGLVGLGASAIGELGGAYFQNTRKAVDYEKSVGDTGLATFRGHVLSEDDRRRKWLIQTLMCRFKVDFSEFANRFRGSFQDFFSSETKALEKFADEGLLDLSADKISITQSGQLFIRNIAMVFDAYLNRQKTATYSKTV